MGFKIPSVLLKKAEVLNIKKMKTGQKIQIKFDQKRYDVLDFSAHQNQVNEGDFIDFNSTIYAK